MHAILAVILLSFANPGNDNFLYHHQVTAQPGDGAIKLLARYKLNTSNCNLTAFYELNGLGDKDPLLAGKKYYMPVRIYRYNGKSIRSTIGDQNYEKAVRIKNYNEWLTDKNLRRKSYLDSKILWVPHHELNCTTPSKAKPVAKTSFHLPILGKKYAKVNRESKALQGQVFYLMSGHGGPDPGALGKRSGNRLCEDEYAYDVTLRLYRALIEHGAEAYMIVEDGNDGIRDDEILLCDRDEKVAGADLPLNQLKRLNQRVIQVNQLYKRNKKKGVKKQTCIAIHVDSRGVNHKQDVFFYHHPGSKSSKKLALDMQKTFQNKYKRHRKNNSYSGTVEERNLYVLKNTLPKALYVELANIQNKSDHRRILQPSNRQALANWLLQGFLGS